ncbi:MAG: DUF4124 domain-containing protein [Pseudomonadales bacterium]|nr:DUF4124 domain-containing protein [Pseudomonadales bacterium]
MAKYSFITIAAFSLAIFTGSTVEADIYRWTDSHGETHYGDKAPAEYKTTTTKLKGSSTRASTQKTSASAKTLKSRLAQLNESKAQQKEEQLKTKKERTMKAHRTKNCVLAKENLKTMQERARIRVKGKDGEYRMLSHEEKTRKETELKKQIKEFCAK